LFAILILDRQYDATKYKIQSQVFSTFTTSQRIIKMKIILKYLFIILSVILPGLLWGQQPKREFRGMWIATVNNLDWPSKAGDKAEKQQQELINMLDTLEKLNFNAVIFQIRPAADAFYRSKSEP